jgi:flagellar protein FlaG
MEPKAALSAIRDFIAPVAPSNAPDVSEGAKVVVDQSVKAGEVETSLKAERAAATEVEKPVDDGPQPGDLRLVIELDDASGAFVYKTVDRRTGETLQQFPREEVLKMRDGPDYETGDVFDGQA